MSTINTNWSNNLKNLALTAIAELSTADYRISAIEGTSTSKGVSDITLTAGSVANPSASLSSAVSIVIEPNSTINRIRVTGVFPATSPGRVTVLDFVLPTAIEFPDGGTLVINSLTLGLSDPA